jgi:hypothetical protein
MATTTATATAAATTTTTTTTSTPTAATTHTTTTTTWLLANTSALSRSSVCCNAFFVVQRTLPCQLRLCMQEAYRQSENCLSHSPYEFVALVCRPITVRFLVIARV